VAGAGVLVVGFVAGLVFLITQLLGQCSGITPDIQLVVPGTHEIYLEEPGKYTIFYEYQSVVDSKVYSTGQVSGLWVSLVSKDDHRDVPLSKPSTSTSYEWSGRAGESIFEFEIAEPGTYVLTADYSGGSGTDIVLAIGQFNFWGVIRTILIGLGIFCVALIVGGFVILITYIKRRRKSSAMNAYS